MSQEAIVEPGLRVIAICGSLRRVSYTRMALEVALRGAAEVGAETQLIDLNDYALPFCHGEKDESSYPEGVFRLRDDVHRAQGILLGTPEYHGSFSGVLKNALDLMGFQQFEGKMIGLVGVAGGAMGAFHALTSLRLIGRALHAWVVPEQVSIPRAQRVFDEQGQMLDAELERRTLEVGRQVARFSYLHTSKQALEFLRLWENAPSNPGG